ncbi:MAG: BACON domain-containing protein, partial [Bacteroidales bacterium]|nr:BACON domain-containing protein [Bacteroidales bacterium]
IQLSQAGAPAPYLWVDAFNLAWAWDDTQERSVTVDANYEWTASVSDDSHWIITPAADGKSLTIAPQSKYNNTSQTLHASVYVRSKGIERIIDINHKHRDPDTNLKLDVTDLKWDWNATDAKSVKVTANYEWTASVSDEAHWVLTPAADGKSLAIAPKAQNQTETSCTATVTVTCREKELTIQCRQGGYFVLDGHEYVDLGLTRGDIYGQSDPDAGKKVVFAKMNIGAEKETDFGYYFRWGEQQGWIVTGDGYVSLNETNCVQAGTGNKWNDQSWKLRDSRVTNTDVPDICGKINQGPVNGIIYGDAATYNWGGRWRMIDGTLLNKLQGNMGSLTIGSVTLKISYDTEKGVVAISNEELGTSVKFPISSYIASGARWDTSVYSWTTAVSTQSILDFLALKVNAQSIGINAFNSYYALPVRPVAEF